jgi:hypothetical protein
MFNILCSAQSSRKAFGARCWPGTGARSFQDRLKYLIAMRDWVLRFDHERRAERGM